MLIIPHQRMTEILGHFHPLFVHLPIGILMLVFAASFFPKAKWDLMKSFITLALIITASSAILACLSGYMLSRSGEYDQEIVNKHLWLGMATAVLSLICLAIPTYQRPLVWLTTLVMAVAGHYGGTLTHGEGYLFSSVVEKEQTEDSSDTTPIISQNLIAKKDSGVQVKIHSPFLNDIKPILQQKCYSCHSSLKKKGGLRLDTEAFILKGGKNGKIISPKNPANSTLYTHLVLPEDDELHMPPKGKKQLTSKEINTIERWIVMGASFTTTTETIAATSSTTIPKENHINSSPSLPVKPVDVFIDVVDTKSLDKMGLITEQNEKGLSINFVNIKTITPDMVDEIKKYNANISELKLNAQQQVDEFLTALPVLPQLKKINLSRSSVSNKGIEQIKKFPKLEKIHLYETSISDEAIVSLSAANALKELFIWKTNISTKAITQLSKQKPSLQIEAGLQSLKSLDSLKK